MLDQEPVAVKGLQERSHHIVYHFLGISKISVSDTSTVLETAAYIIMDGHRYNSIVPLQKTKEERRLK